MDGRCGRDRNPDVRENLGVVSGLPGISRRFARQASRNQLAKWKTTLQLVADRSLIAGEAGEQIFLPRTTLLGMCCCGCRRCSRSYTGGSSSARHFTSHQGDEDEGQVFAWESAERIGKAERNHRAAGLCAPGRLI